MDYRPAYMHGRGRGRGRSGGGRGTQPGSYPYYQSHHSRGGRGGGGRYNNTDHSGSSYSGGYHVGNHGSHSGGGYGGSSQDSVNFVDQREYQQPTAEASWNKKRSSSSSSSSSVHDNNSNHTKEKFEEVSAQHQAAVAKHLSRTGSGDSNHENEHESSSEEDDLNDESILESVFKSFKGTGPGAEELYDSGLTQELLMASVKSKANVCLICIETIGRNAPIWSCSNCYCMHHIVCIQKWVRDGVYQKGSFDDDNSANKDIPWNCPKCRHEYKQSECPSRYFCFCAKEEDPTFDPWVLPHSCGNRCGKKLKPQCGHECLVLCHPGPCPPCPQIVRVVCYCRKATPQTKRCGAKEWSCGKPCLGELSCGHRCQVQCHPGDCPPCPHTSKQPCQCGKESELKSCADAVWQCAKVCSKLLACGHHTCEKVCHPGDCGGCPRSERRTCPCGKTEFKAPCTEDVPTCMNTCDKKLECGLHECTQRCHYQPCGICREMVAKKCRCGTKTKEVQCYKEFTCDTKCTTVKNCGNHQCRRRCCDGNCAPCEQPCNKTLKCRNHKCASICHPGPCYPCSVMVTKSCGCGLTVVRIPCGREKITKPPKCNKLCKRPSNCHHPERENHKCHFGDCPPCRQVCGQKLEKCGHICPVTCHTAVRTKIKAKVQRAGPWEPEPETRIEEVNQPCPPCQVPVQVTCLGKHEVATYACCVASVSSCHRPCGRQLSCTNHTCEIECHEVLGAMDGKTAGRNCEKCEELCSKPRPEGCNHICVQSCHSGPCNPCNQMIRMRCHCQGVVQYIECDRWTQADDWQKQRLKSCPSRCPKTLTCGHLCTSKCHPGPCPSAERCTEKVKVRCPCRRQKQEFLCNEIILGLAKVECDDTCLQIQEKHKKEQEDAERKKREEEEQKLLEEQEALEKRKQGKSIKRRRRRQHFEEEEPTFLEKHKRTMVVSTVVLMVAIIVYYLFWGSS